MPTLKEIGARINAVTAIKMTTEAMKMIAQAKVTKAEARLKHCRLFSVRFVFLVFSFRSIVVCVIGCLLCFIYMCCFEL